MRGVALRARDNMLGLVLAGYPRPTNAFESNACTRGWHEGALSPGNSFCEGGGSMSFARGGGAEPQ
jgi:hypothetical protein